MCALYHWLQLVCVKPLLKRHRGCFTAPASMFDDMAKLLSLSVVSGEEIEELADLWAGGGRESHASVQVILGEIVTVEQMVSFLALNLKDNLQDSVLIAASTCTLWQLRTHMETGFCQPQSPPRINYVEPFCQYRPELTRMSIAQKLSCITPSALKSARHTFQKALRISSEKDSRLLQCPSWRRLLEPSFVLASDWLPHLQQVQLISAAR